MEVKDWNSELADLQTMIAQMEVRRVQEPVLEEGWTEPYQFESGRWILKKRR